MAPRVERIPRKAFGAHADSTFSECFAFSTQTLRNFRVVLPRAPTRYVTAQDTQMTSWFDVKFRN